MAQTPLSQRFPYIFAWGILVNSTPQYRQQEAEVAAADQVPEDVTHRDEWASIASHGRHERALDMERHDAATILRRNGEPYRVWYRIGAVTIPLNHAQVTYMARRIKAGQSPHTGDGPFADPTLMAAAHAVARAAATRLLRVAEGDEFEMVMAATDPCRRLHVAGQVRTVRIHDGAVQIRNEDPHARPIQLTDDGQWLRVSLTPAEAGIHRDDHGLYVDPLPDELVQVCRDGAVVSARMVDDNTAQAWLLHHQGHSVDYAVTHGGYEIRAVRPMPDAPTPDDPHGGS